MLQAIRKHGLSFIWPAVMGALLALGLILPVLGALEMGGASTAIWTCLLVAACCAVIGVGKVFRWIGYAGCAAVVVVMLVTTGTITRIPDMIEAVVQLVQGNAEGIKAYGAEFALLAGAILTIMGWSMARQSAGFFPALTLTLIVLLVIWFSPRRDVVPLFAPALVSLAAMYARSALEETPVGRVLVSAALVVILALMVSPVMQIRSPKMEKFADDLRNYITDTLFFTETRSVYSIQVDGFKPLEQRLGGPVQLENRPVMTVETPTTIYLRGAIYNEYNGLNWRTNLSSRRYLYSDPRNRSIRMDTMDESRPDSTLKDSDLFTPANIRIKMHADSASTLFVPLRVQSLTTPMSLVPYFNLSSEVFITRDLQVEDTYTITAPVINSWDDRLPAVAAQAASMTSERRDMSGYLNVPNEVADGVRSITAEIVASAYTPLEKALAIQNYLQSAYQYSLSPSVPPDNQDFVSHFLLKEKKGYCTYFASAMAVMGRLAGLPTRYVEGYLVQPYQGVAQVTSKNAHAWTEVYLEGFGWVTFDATPPENRGGPRRNQTQDEVEQQLENQDDLPPQDLQDEGESNNPEPTPSMDPDEPQGEDDNNEDDNPESDEPTPTPDPTPTPTPPPPEQQEDEDDFPEDVPEDTQEDAPTPEPQQKNRSLWWIWLIVLAVAGVLTWRGITTRPEYLAGKHTTQNARLLTWYRALLGLLAASGMPARSYETPAAYAARVEKGIPEEAGFAQVAEAVTRLGYGHKKATDEQVAKAAACYRAVWHAVPVKGKAKWFVKRMLKGVGSVRQVP